MKIAQVTPYDYTHPGGVSQHIHHLKTEFEKLGHEVVVMAPNSSSGGLEVEPGFYGIGRTVTVPANGSQSRLTIDITLYNAVKRILDREQFDIVHVHEPLTPLLTHMVLINSKSVNIATFHAARQSNPWYVALRPYFASLLTRLDARICVSEPAREMVDQYFPSDYWVIPNGIDVAHFSPEVQPFDWAFDGTPRILFVGRYNELRKGFKYLHRAMPLVQQQFPDARLVVVGPGKPATYIDQEDRYGIKNVDYEGVAEFADLPRYYASCDVFAAPSTGGESFGIILLEAMATGKAPVATNIPGYASVISHGYDGLLVPPEDSVGMSIGLVRALSNSGQRAEMGVNARATALQYDWPSVAQQVLAVYDQALAARSIAP